MVYVGDLKMSRIYCVSLCIVKKMTQFVWKTKSSPLQLNCGLYWYNLTVEVKYQVGNWNTTASLHYNTLIGK